MKLSALGLGLWLLTAPVAHAGPWPRDPGTGFVALSYELTTPRAALSAEALAVDSSPDTYPYTALYAEWGLTQRITMGLDTGWPENAETWTGIAFANFALGPLDARHRFAAQLGIGQRRYVQPGPFYPQESHETELVLRPGVSWGYGFSGKLEGGWATMETNVELRQDTGGRAVKLDTTLGLRSSQKSAYLIQLQTGDYPNADPYAKLLTSYIYDLTPNIALETGFISGLRGDDSLGLRIATWIRF